VSKPAKKYKRKKKLGQYHYASVIFTTTLALFVIGIFGVLMLQTNELKTNIQRNIELQVYLNKDISSTQRGRIESQIESSGMLLEVAESMTFISKEEAASSFIEDTGEDFSEFLGENPLRDALTLKINPQFQTNAKLDSLSQSIERISGVFEVTYVQDLVDSINSNITKVALVLLSISILLTLIVLLLINNAIKLALFSQRFLIRSMQLVGAKSSFIKSPFLKRSLGNGAVAGIISSVLLYLLLEIGNKNIQGLDQLYNLELLLILFGILIILGAFIAYFSTLRAMNKYLKLSLDELY